MMDECLSSTNQVQVSEMNVRDRIQTLENGEGVKCLLFMRIQIDIKCTHNFRQVDVAHGSKSYIFSL